MIDSLLKILAISTDSDIILPDHNKLALAHIYAWKNRLKTGSYYIRSLPVTEATKFSIDIDQINLIKIKRNVNNLNIESNYSKKNCSDKNFCESCSA